MYPSCTLKEESKQHLLLLVVNTIGIMFLKSNLRTYINSLKYVHKKFDPIFLLLGKYNESI